MFNRMTEDEFLEWFEKNNGIHEAYGAAWFTYKTFCYQPFFGKTETPDLNTTDLTVREKFEAWYKTTRNLRDHAAIRYGTALKLQSNGNYVWYEAQVSWEAWLEQQKTIDDLKKQLDK